MISGPAYKGKRWPCYDIWQNSEFGLYVTIGLCQLGGSFVLGSGASVLYLGNGGHEIYDTMFDGTVVRLRLTPST